MHKQLLGPISPLFVKVQRTSVKTGDGSFSVPVKFTSMSGGSQWRDSEKPLCGPLTGPRTCCQDVREVSANVKVNSPKLFLLRKATLGLLGENPAVVTKYTV